MKDKINVDGYIIKNLSPIKKSFINKNKKFSARGICNDKKVKIYEVFDENQGFLRQFVSKNKKLSLYFPKLITFNKKFIVEEWLEGELLSKMKPSFFYKMKYSFVIKKIIHQMWITKYNKEVFDYIGYIYKRLGKKCEFDLGKIPLRINHNDLSLDNILKTNEGIKIIDNEFLGNNRGWILNFKNSFLKSGPIKNKYISKKELAELWKIRNEWGSISLKSQ